MIIRWKHRWRNVAAAVLLCAELASCSQDDLPGIQQSGLLPDGEYPLMLTASVDEMKTRAAGKDAWTDGDAIGVRIGADGAAGHYKLNADGTVKEAVTLVYWQNAAPADVKAWYPYTPQEDVDISDQSKGFAAFDYLTAVAENRTFQNPVELKFKHRMAKVSYRLQKGGTITDGELASATVQIAGYTSATFAEGKLTGKNQGWITPTSDKDALLVPQNMTGKRFIKVSINNKDFYYTPASKTSGGLLEAGNPYHYTITVTPYGIKVTAATGEWAVGNTEDVKETIIYNGTETEPKIGDYYYSDGTWSDGGLRKLNSDGTMEWAETTPQPNSDKTCIGIVFYTGQHPDDHSNYVSTGIGQVKCHGYVVALTDVHDDMNDRLRWEHGPNKEKNRAVGTSTDYSDWQGYSNILKIHEFVNDDANKADGWEMKHFPAALACETYGKRTVDRDGNPANGKYDWQQQLSAPSNTSGWFLPSLGQLEYLYQNQSVLSARMDALKNSVSNNCNYKDKIKWFKKSYYFASTEVSSFTDRAYRLHFDRDERNNAYKSTESDVRAVLAF